MRRLFRKSCSSESGDNWLICWCGHDEATNDDFNVTTDGVHASELYLYTDGAESDADLIASLLNWYHNNKEQARKILIADGIEMSKEEEA